MVKNKLFSVDDALPYEMAAAERCAWPRPPCAMSDPAWHLRGWIREGGGGVRGPIPRWLLRLLLPVLGVLFFFLKKKKICPTVTSGTRFSVFFCLKTLWVTGVVCFLIIDFSRTLTFARPNARLHRELSLTRFGTHVWEFKNLNNLTSEHARFGQSGSCVLFNQCHWRPGRGDVVS